jgi:hypothetical protein
MIVVILICRQISRLAYGSLEMTGANDETLVEVTEGTESHARLLINIPKSAECQGARMPNKNVDILTSDSCYQKILGPGNFGISGFG